MNNKYIPESGQSVNLEQYGMLYPDGGITWADPGDEEPVVQARWNEGLRVYLLPKDAKRNFNSTLFGVEIANEKYQAVAKKSGIPLPDEPALRSVKRTIGIITTQYTFPEV